jgi:putative hydrolase of the HAD superfamily
MHLVKKALIFDIGGVLIGSIGKPFLKHSANVLQVPIGKLKNRIQMEEIGLELGKITPLQFWNNVCNKLNIIPPNNKILNSLWLYNYRQNAVVDRDVLAVLKKLKKSKYPLVAISNTQKAHVKINRKRNLYQYFDFTLLSCEVGLRKPDKAIFVAASKKAHASFGNLIFIDDELRWIKVAKSYGLKTIHFKSAGQLKKELLKLEIL